MGYQDLVTLRLCGIIKITQWDRRESLETGLSSAEQWESISFIFYFIYLFIYFWLHWLFVAPRGLSLVAVSGGYTSLLCTGFSLRWLFSRHAGYSSCGSRALERGLSSCGARA